MSELEDLLAPIRGRADKATEGPWAADTGVRGDCVVWGPNGRFLMNAQSEPHWLEYPGEKRMVSFDVDARDATFIAAARTDIPRLLATLDAVLALHYEDLFRGHLSNGCKTCGHDWPCPTVAAITDTLKET